MKWSFRVMSDQTAW